MSDFTNKMASFVGVELKKPVQKITREDLADSIGVVVKRLGTIADMFDRLPVTDIDAFNGRIHDTSVTTKRAYVDLYIGMEIKFQRADDRKTAFSGFINTARSYLDVLNTILRKIADITESRTINIYNARLSHAAVFGLIAQADRFADFTLNLFSGVLFDTIEHNGVSEIEPPAKEVLPKLLEDKDDMIQIVNNISTIGPASLKNMINHFAFADDTLVDDEHKPNVNVNVGNLSNVQKHFIQYGFGMLSYIFRWFGEIGNVLRASKAQKAMKEQEWMKERISLLQMDLAGMDPDSKEYRNIVKSVDKYGKMIADLDKSLQKYQEK